MKNIILALAITCFGYSNAVAQKAIQIKNKTDENRSEIVAIPFAKFSKHFGVDTVFTVKDKTSRTNYIHQLEKLGSTQVQNVLIQVSVAAKSSLDLIVTKEKAVVYDSKVYARYVPERFDDFAWENDLVAFRIYGKALEGRKDDAQGMDYWAKRTSNLIINKWYKENDYHKDHGEGLDYYAVGQTLGAGYLALFFGDKIHYTKHYRGYQVLDNGPLRTTFKLTYEAQDFDGNTVSMDKTISLDAGQQFNKVVVDLNNANTRETPVVVGLAKRGESNPEYEFDQSDRTLAYWEPDVQNSGRTGTALVLPKSKIQFIPNEPTQFLIKTTIKNGKPLVYYTGAAWNKAGKITSADDWEDFVEDYAESLRKPLHVKLR